MSLTYVTTELQKDKEGIWTTGSIQPFNYTDGADTERFLENTLRNSSDLSTFSHELESQAHDWPTDYHLNRARGNLLRDLELPRESHVLEVGCGCGAITRVLSENYDKITSVEGSYSRARLARLRNRDCENVDIICAPFQDIEFSEKFDVIFCIGVFEYSNVFVEADDPFDYILKYFRHLLKPNGRLVLAIENQFGLKYMAGLPEDHTGVPYDGIEGYSRYENRAKTFGKHELGSMLNRYFDELEWLYPFPDYKLPRLVVSDEFMQRDTVDMAETVGGFNLEGYRAAMKPAFDATRTYAELGRNKQAAFFAHSFLVVANVTSGESKAFSADAVFYSANRKKQYSTVTEVRREQEGGSFANKKLVSQEPVDSGEFQWLPTKSQWHAQASLHFELTTRLRERNTSASEAMSVLSVWWHSINEQATANGGQLPGNYLDAIWQNCHVVDGKCEFFDLEWDYAGELTPNTLLIRAGYRYFLQALDDKELAKKMGTYSIRKCIKQVADALRVQLADEDIDRFIHIEAKLSNTIFGQEIGHAEKTLKLMLVDWRVVDKVRSARYFSGRVSGALKHRWRKFSKK